MRIVVLRTLAEQTLGLQHMAEIPDGTLFVFPGVPPGGVFHARNVPGPFDIMFLSADYRLLKKETVRPPDGSATAPPGTAIVIEARAGLLASVTQ